jgi:hypothetical protein
MTSADHRSGPDLELGLGRRALRVFTRLAVRPYKQPRPPTKKVAIVVPLSLRPGLLPEEEVSMRHLCHFLGKYDKYLAAPAGSFVQREGFTTVSFPRKFFGSMAAHGRFMYWPKFYKVFEEYEYILIYHLDALVFSDDLLQWCEAGWDYIGAPWLPCPDSEWVKEPAVGNGGFTLMKVESCLRVLYNRYREDPLSYVADVVTFNGSYLGPLFRLLENLRRIFPRSRVLRWPLLRWQQSEEPGPAGLHNDLFWSFHARRYMPHYKVATVEDALKFAFEVCPRMCYEMNNRQLPFGCHAWARYDRAFWQPYLLRAS